MKILRVEIKYVTFVPLKDQSPDEFQKAENQGAMNIARGLCTREIDIRVEEEKEK